MNADPSWDHPATRTSATLLNNLTGERIHIATGVGPDIYEKPGLSLDLILSQRFGKHWKANVSAKNLLDPSFEFSYGAGSKFSYSSHCKGRTFGLSLGADL